MPISSFTAKGKAADGRPYRVEWNGGGTEVQPIMPFLLIEGGEDEDVGLDPIWPRSLRLFLKEVDLEPLFGLGEQAVPVEAYELSGGSDTLAYKGFMATNFYSDVPWSQNDTVEIRALDGLGTLENSTLDELPFAGDDYVPLTEAIARILGSLYGLEVEFGTHWYPDAGGVLTSSDCSLAQVGFDPDNYREDRPEGSWWSQLEVLKDLCKEQGLIIKQVERPGGVRWLVAQRDAYESDGSLKVWRYDATGAELSGQPVTLDRKRTLSYDGTDLIDEGGRDFVRRRKSVTVTHDHAPLDNLVADPGFENAGKGNSSPWTISDTEKLSAQVVSHDEPDNTPSASQDNTYLAQIKGVPAGGSNYPQDTPEFPISQTIGTVTGAQPRTAGRIKQSFEGNNTEFSSANNGILLRISIGGYFLGTRSATLTTDVRRGEGSLYCTEVARPIPKGAVLPVVKTSTQQGENEFQGTLTLSERAEPGDTELLGTLSSDFNESREILYPSVETTEQVFRVQRFVKNPRAYPSFEIIFAFEKPNGEPLQGDITYEVGGERLINRTENTSTPIPDDYIYGGDAVYIDDIEFSLERDESKIDQTVVRATVPELGEAEAQTVRTSSGPTTQNLARVRGIDPNGTPFEPTQWGVGPLEDRTESDRTLAQLKAFQRLRYWQIHLEELTITEATRGGTLPLTGDELVTIDGTDYTVHSVRYDAAAGETRATLIEYTDFQS